jgi:hypothetical protein
MKIDGLPEGVEAIRFGVPKPEEYVIENDPVGPEPLQITKGPRLAGTVSSVIVAPADGYEFVYRLRTLDFAPVKKMEPLTITASAKFVVTNEVDKGIVEDRIEDLKKLPGYQE